MRRHRRPVMSTAVALGLAAGSVALGSGARAAPAARAEESPPGAVRVLYHDGPSCPSWLSWFCGF